MVRRILRPLLLWLTGGQLAVDLVAAPTATRAIRDLPPLPATASDTLTLSRSRRARPHTDVGVLGAASTFASDRRATTTAVAITVAAVSLAALLAVAIASRRRLAALRHSHEQALARRVASLTDEIERQRTTIAATRESQDRYDKAFRASPLISAISRYPDGAYIDVNRAFTDILGYGLDEIRGRTALELGIWAQPEQRAAILASLEAGEPVRGVECHLRTRSHAIRTVLTSVERFQLGGQPTLLFVSLDISGRIRHEALLRQAEKMEAIGLLSGGIAHDFNNIVGAILGNAQMAAMDLTPDHPAAVSVQQITESARRATRLVRQLLAFARLDTPRKRTTDLRSVVRQAIENTRQSRHAATTVACCLPDSPCFTNGDDSQLVQALTHLLTNAHQALEDQPGRITVRLDAVDITPADVERHPDLKTGPHLRLSVEDTGHGMDAATIERIFDPFFSTRDPGCGTGLGLSVVHGIVHSHDGTIAVTSAKGVGTRIDLYLPGTLQQTPFPPGSPSTHPTSSAPNFPSPPHVPIPSESEPAPPTGIRRGNGEPILFIDDEAIIAKTSASALRRFGYQVSAFTSPEEGLRTFLANPDAFRLVITDFAMPQLSGVDVAREVLKARPGFPLIVTSGFISEQNQRAIKATGVRHLLRKPSSLEEFSAAVETALRPTDPADPTQPSHHG